MRRLKVFKNELQAKGFLRSGVSPCTVMIPEAEEHGSAELSFVAFSQSSTTQLLFAVRRHDPWRLGRTAPLEKLGCSGSAKDLVGDNSNEERSSRNLLANDKSQSENRREL